MTTSLTPMVTSLFEDDSFSGLQGTKRHWIGPFQQCEKPEPKKDRCGGDALTMEEITALGAGESLYLGANVPIVPINTCPPFEVSSVLLHAAKTAASIKSDYHAPARAHCAGQVVDILSMCRKLKTLEVDFFPQRALPDFEKMVTALPCFHEISSLTVSTRATLPQIHSPGLIFRRPKAPPFLQESDFPAFPLAIFGDAMALKVLKLSNFLYRADASISRAMSRRVCSSNLTSLELSGVFGRGGLTTLVQRIDLGQLRELRLDNRVFSGGEKTLQDGTQDVLKAVWTAPHPHLQLLSLKNFNLLSAPEFALGLSSLDVLFPELIELHLINTHRWHVGVHFSPAQHMHIRHAKLNQLSLEEAMAPRLSELSLKQLPALRSLTLKYAPWKPAYDGPEQRTEDWNILIQGGLSQLKSFDLGQFEVEAQELDTLCGLPKQRLPKKVFFVLSPKISNEELAAAKKRLSGSSAPWLKETLDTTLSARKKQGNRKERLGERQVDKEKNMVKSFYVPTEGADFYPPRPKQR